MNLQADMLSVHELADIQVLRPLTRDDGQGFHDLSDIVGVSAFISRLGDIHDLADQDGKIAWHHIDADVLTGATLESKSDALAIGAAKAADVWADRNELLIHFAFSDSVAATLSVEEAGLVVVNLLPHGAGSDKAGAANLLPRGPGYLALEAR